MFILQMMTRAESHVLLDISHCPKDLVTSHFPNILARCAKHGVDITQDPIPVVPTQHYMCGGVQTGLLGETGIAGLFACGEVACTGTTLILPGTSMHFDAATAPSLFSSLLGSWS